MKPKTTVKLKAGTLSLSEPENLGVVLTLRKAGKKRLVEVYTLKGKATLGREKVKEQALSPYQGDLADKEALREHLRKLLRQPAKGRVAERGGEEPRELTEASLWEAVRAREAGAEPGVWGINELAGAWFASDRPSASQISELEGELRGWRETGLEYFRARGRSYQPLTKSQLKANRHKAQELKELMGVFRAARGLEEESEEEEGDEENEPAFQRPLERVALSQEQEGLLEELCPLLAHYVTHGKWPEEGPYGPGVAMAAGHDWRRGLAQIAKLQSGSRYTTDAAAKFLVWRGYWDPSATLTALTERLANTEEFPFALEYPNYLVASTDKLEEQLGEGDLAGRTDLRHLVCHTIDPPTARDFDDAVGLEPGAEGLVAGQTTLWVHIADVSHYVKPDTALDEEALKRATSVYLPHRVLPMLPPRLSDDLCSLRAGVDRLAVSVRLVVDSEGRVVETTPHRSVIRVAENLSYPEALERAHNGDEHLAPLFELAARMRGPRDRLEVESKERKIHLEPEQIRLEWKGATEATEAIETFMVAANEGVAEWLTERGLALPYRCHDRPGRSAIEELNETLRLAQVGLEVAIDWEAVEGLQEQMEGAAEEGAEGEAGAGLEATLAQMAGAFGGSVTLKLPAEMEGLLAAGTDEEREASAYPSEAELELAALYRQGLNQTLRKLYAELAEDLAPVVVGLVLRAAREAYYTTSNSGHFGLGSRCYCHYTSPIRRYPDLLVHRQLKAALTEGEPPHTLEELAQVTDHCSQRSKQAAAFEYRIIDICLALKGHLEELVGQTQTGRVQGLIPGRVFVQLANGSEGALATRTLGVGLELDASGALLLGPVRAQGHMADKLGSALQYEIEGQPAEPLLKLGQKLLLRVVGTDLLEGRLEVSLAQKLN